MGGREHMARVRSRLTSDATIEVRPFGFIHNKVGSAAGTFDILVQGGRAFRETKDDANDQANSAPNQPSNFGLHLIPCPSNQRVRPD